MLTLESSLQRVRLTLSALLANFRGYPFIAARVGLFIVNNKERRYEP